MSNALYIRHSEAVQERGMVKYATAELTIESWPETVRAAGLPR